MDITIVLALIGAALFHASWHAIIKGRPDKLSGLAGMNVVSTAVAALALAWVPLPIPEVWPIIAASVVLHNAYKISLARAYLVGDLGQAFPVARGTAPIFATAIAFAVIGEQPALYEFLAIVLISSGLLFFAFEGQGPGANVKMMVGGALTGLMVGLYSVLDGYGIRISGHGLSFAAWLVTLDGLAFVIVVWFWRGHGLWTTLRNDFAITLMSGVLGLFAFGVFLWALNQGAIGSVTALREMSILFASLIGVVFLGEKMTRGRLAGAIIIMAGVMAYIAGGSL
ncbi:DMT family transporter [Magnetovibrio sp.]|uniref:DMT family transporter n=1 Tax=Magnetovibrio sp. TaxID=2024836 RepID=UPI002F94CEE4